MHLVLVPFIMIERTIYFFTRCCSFEISALAGHPQWTQQLRWEWGWTHRNNPPVRKKKQKERERASGVQSASLEMFVHTQCGQEESERHVNKKMLMATGKEFTAKESYPIYHSLRLFLFIFFLSPSSSSCSSSPSFRCLLAAICINITRSHHWAYKKSKMNVSSSGSGSNGNCKSIMKKRYHALKALIQIQISLNFV